MKKNINQRRNYSSMNLKDAMQMIGRTNLIHWKIESENLEPSAHLQEDLRRLEYFDLQGSEPAKTLLIDTLLAEIVPRFEKLKVWKEVTISTDTLTGVADYIMAPRRAYMETPLLCVVEAKKDDFEGGQAQCLAEMVACKWTNEQSNSLIDIFGVVSNGQGWQFYKLTASGEAFATDQYGLENLPRILGVLDFICAACAKNVPSSQ